MSARFSRRMFGAIVVKGGVIASRGKTKNVNFYVCDVRLSVLKPRLSAVLAALVAQISVQVVLLARNGIIFHRSRTI